MQNYMLILFFYIYIILITKTLKIIDDENNTLYNFVSPKNCSGFNPIWNTSNPNKKLKSKDV